MACVVLLAPAVAGVFVWVESIGVVPKMSWRDALQAWGSLRRQLAAGSMLGVRQLRV